MQQRPPRTNIHTFLNNMTPMKYTDMLTDRYTNGYIDPHAIIVKNTRNHMKSHEMMIQLHTLCH